MVVTATRSPQRAVDALRDVVVISREEIDRAGPVSLAELLQREAQVEFRGTGGPGQPVGIFLRGANAGQTLVLVDGLRVGSASVGTTSIENIPLDLVERIEVVKGPLSSLYGPDAIGGVVQFTRASQAALLPRRAAPPSERPAGFTAMEGTTVSFRGGAKGGRPAPPTSAPFATTRTATATRTPSPTRRSSRGR
jgi:vitamin B12 transporter